MDTDETVVWTETKKIAKLRKNYRKEIRTQRQNKMKPDFLFIKSIKSQEVSGTLKS